MDGIRAWWSHSHPRTFRFERILRPDEVVEGRRRRFVLLPHTMFGSTMGVAPYIDMGSFTAPVFEAVFAWAGPRTWAGLWSVAALLGAYHMLTSGWAAYRVCNILTLALASAWITALLEARITGGFVVSLPAYGLWGFIILTCLVVAILPTPVLPTRDRRSEEEP